MNVSYLFLAPGFEEMEAIAVVDVLRRGGVDVRTVSVGGGNEVTGAHQVTIRADVSLEQIRPPLASGHSGYWEIFQYQRRFLA